jgi:hypothetical protein
MALPTLTVAQRDEALLKAQAARLAHKQLLAAIATGEQTIPAVLDRAKTDAVVGRTKGGRFAGVCPVGGRPGSPRCWRRPELPRPAAPPRWASANARP